jgi:transcriptional regulator with XRE-family HTH domain
MTGGLGQRLEALRKRAGISQQRMAAELGLNVSDISAVEVGLRTFTSFRWVEDWASIAGADSETSRLLSLWRESASAAGIEFL